MLYINSNGDIMDTFFGSTKVDVAPLTLPEIAVKARATGWWDDDCCRALCQAAGMLEAYQSAGERFEAVIYDAAVKLGVLDLIDDIDQWKSRCKE